jgi:hypothetical protein
MEIKARYTPENISDVRRIKHSLLQKISLASAEQTLAFSTKHLGRTQIKVWSTPETISDIRRLKPGLHQKTYLTYADKSMVYS